MPANQWIAGRFGRLRTDARSYITLHYLNKPLRPPFN